MKKIFAVMAVLMLVCIGVAALADTIPEAKQKADNQPVTLSGKVVTYASANFFYIEEDSRCSGIRVERTAHGLAVGMRADVTGNMKTNTNRERYILPSIAPVQTAPPNATGTIAPIGMNNRELGGDDWQVVGTGGQKGTSNSSGVNNIGLLVKTWGRYQQVDATTFTLDDGSGLFVKCTVPAGTFLYSGWQYVTVTGISSMYKYNTSIYPPNLLVSLVQSAHKAPGKIVQVNDEWVLSEEGFSDPNDPCAFALNVARWFTGGQIGAFLVYSNDLGLTGPSLASCMRDAGHTWTVSTSVTFDLPTLLAYDGVFVGGCAADNSVLTSYVNAGGNVYLLGGSGGSGNWWAPDEAAAWNPFLVNFGLRFADDTFNSICESVPIASSHPIFSGVDHLYQCLGQSVFDLSPVDPSNQVLVDYNGEGLYAVFDGSSLGNTLPRQ